MELAKRGRSDDEIASGWGKIPAETRPIVASWAPNDRCSLTPAEFRWELWSVAPTLTTLNFSKPHSIAFRVHRPQPTTRRIKTSASTKAIDSKHCPCVPKTTSLPVHTSNLAVQEVVAKKEKPAIQSSKMGRRKNSFMDQQVSETPCSLGEEIRKLSRHAAILLCIHHTQGCRCFGIGS